MRFFAIILSILLFYLTIMPCSDALTCEEEKRVELSQNHDHSKDKNDFCTPLCICQCCSTSMVYPDLELNQNEKLNTIFSYHALFTFNYSHKYHKRVWHPPNFI